MQYDLGFEPSERRDAFLRKTALPAVRRKAGEQLALPGLVATRANNMLFAIRAPEPVGLQASRIASRFIQKYGLRGPPIGLGRYHITLHGLGTFDGRCRDIEAKAKDAASRIEVMEFPIRFDRIMSFARKDGGRPLVLVASHGNEELFDFRRQLVEAMKRSGLASKARKAFMPHMTLLYDYKAVPEQQIEPLQWMARAFSLVDSEQGFSRHTERCCWPLRISI